MAHRYFPCDADDCKSEEEKCRWQWQMAMSSYISAFVGESLRHMVRVVDSPRLGHKPTRSRSFDDVPDVPEYFFVREEVIHGTPTRFRQFSSKNLSFVCSFTRHLSMSSFSFHVKPAEYITNRQLFFAIASIRDQNSRQHAHIYGHSWLQHVTLSHCFTTFFL